MVLLRIIDHAAFTDDIDLNLSRIFHLSFDLLGNIPCHQHHIRIRYLLRNNHYSNFTTCLNSKRFFYTFEIVCYFF